MFVFATEACTESLVFLVPVAYPRPAFPGVSSLAALVIEGLMGVTRRDVVSFAELMALISTKAKHQLRLSSEI